MNFHKRPLASPFNSLRKEFFVKVNRITSISSHGFILMNIQIKVILMIPLGCLKNACKLQGMIRESIDRKAVRNKFLLLVFELNVQKLVFLSEYQRLDFLKITLRV